MELADHESDTMTITDAIHIDAPLGLVWSVTQDVERWPEWTPTVTSVRLLGERPIRVGSVAVIKQPMQPQSQWVVTELSANQRFAWETRRPGLYLIGIHDLAASEGGTRNVLRVEASGLLAVALWPILRFAMQKALRDENRGLKARCERGIAAETAG